MGHRSIAQQSFLAAVLSALLVATAGCGLFDTREPEPPRGNIFAQPRTSPTNVIANMKTVFANAQAGISIYDQNLAPDFVFEPDPQDVVEMQHNPFTDWTREREKSNMGSVFDRFGALTLALQLSVQDSSVADPRTDPTADNEVYFRSTPYMVRAHRTAAPDTVFSGNADLYFRDISGTWTIYRWVDIRDASGKKTIGRLKATVEAL